MVHAPNNGEPTGSPENRAPAQRWPWLTAVAAIAALVSFWMWASQADRREIQALPDHQRQALFQRTLEDLRDTCDPAPPRSLREFCRRQAELALKFRECEGSALCQELARRHLSQPRR